MANKPLWLPEFILGALFLALTYLGFRPPVEAAGPRGGPQGGSPLRGSGTQEPAGEEEAERKRMAPDELLAVFSVPRAETVARPAIEAARKTPTQKAPAPAPWLTEIGSIVDEEGSRWLFFKDTRTGRLVKVRADGGEEKDAVLGRMVDDRYLLLLDGEPYAAGRRGKR